MRIIKVDIHGSIKAIVESCGMYASCFDLGRGDTIIINSMDKRLFSICVSSTKIPMLDTLLGKKECLSLYDISVLIDIATLAYGLQQLSEDEIDRWIPGDVKIPQESFWNGL